MKQRRAHILALAAVLVALAAPASPAATFYVDPAAGSMSADGSAAQPWRTLAEVFSNGLIESKNPSGNPINAGAPVKGGDTILLRSGYHGDINVRDYFNDERITVAAEAGHTPQVRRIRLDDFKNWTFDGLTISPQLAPTFSAETQVYLTGVCSYVTIQNCHCYSVDDVSTFNASQWISNTSNGITIRAGCSHISVIDNTIRNTAFGINLSGTDLLVRGNEIINFRGDGIRALNHNQTIEYNTIKNCYNVDSNHDDGIQCWAEGSISGDVRNMIVRGNVIINTEDPNQPLQGTLQGIGFFDGNHINFLIENNLVITDHWHGITILGAENSTIINNTVVNPRWLSGASSLRTWIQIGAKKDGTLATDCVIRNNIAHDYRTSGNVGLAYDHNLTATSANVAGFFVDWQGWDFHLKTGSPAIDAGSSVGAPAVDIEVHARPAGLAWDIGAYEAGAVPGPPVAHAGSDRAVADTGSDGVEMVTLDGSASYDPDGTITSWVWAEGTTELGTGETLQVTLPLGEHVITLTVANDDVPPETDTDTVTITVAETVPIDSTEAWQNFAYDLQMAPFAVEFDARANAASVDALLGLCHGDADWYDDLACIVRFYTNGRIEVRNGTSYTADVAIDYVPGTWYHVRMVIEPTAHTYSVTVTPEGGSPVALATDYAFRHDQAMLDQFDRWATVHSTAFGISIDHFELGSAVAGPTITGWASVASHGAAGDIAAPLSQGGGEPRAAGLDEFQITFDRAVDPTTIVPGCVTVTGAAGGDQSSLIQTLSLASGNTVLTVTLSSALPDADRYTLEVAGTVTDTFGGPLMGDRDILVRVLAGDVDNSGTVGPADILAARNQAGQPLTAAAARYDINGSGATTGSDLLFIRNRLGNALP